MNTLSSTMNINNVVITRDVNSTSIMLYLKDIAYHEIKVDGTNIMFKTEGQIKFTPGKLTAAEMKSHAMDLTDCLPKGQFEIDEGLLSEWLTRLAHGQKKIIPANISFLSSDHILWAKNYGCEIYGTGEDKFLAIESTGGVRFAGKGMLVRPFFNCLSKLMIYWDLQKRDHLARSEVDKILKFIPDNTWCHDVNIRGIFHVHSVNVMWYNVSTFKVSVADLILLDRTLSRSQTIASVHRLAYPLKSHNVTVAAIHLGKFFFGLDTQALDKYWKTKSTRDLGDGLRVMSMDPIVKKLSSYLEKGKVPVPAKWDHGKRMDLFDYVIIADDLSSIIEVSPTKGDVIGRNIKGGKNWVNCINQMNKFYIADGTEDAVFEPIEIPPVDTVIDYLSSRGSQKMKEMMSLIENDFSGKDIVILGEGEGGFALVLASTAKCITAVTLENATCAKFCKDEPNVHWIFGDVGTQSVYSKVPPCDVLISDLSLSKGIEDFSKTITAYASKVRKGGELLIKVKGIDKWNVTWLTNYNVTLLKPRSSNLSNSEVYLYLEVGSTTIGQIKSMYNRYQRDRKTLYDSYVELNQTIPFSPKKMGVDQFLAEMVNRNDAFIECDMDVLGYIAPYFESLSIVNDGFYCYNFIRNKYLGNPEITYDRIQFGNLKQLEFFGFDKGHDFSTYKRLLQTDNMKLIPKDAVVASIGAGNGYPEKYFPFVLLQFDKGRVNDETIVCDILNCEEVYPQVTHVIANNSLDAIFGDRTNNEIKEILRKIFPKAEKLIANGWVGKSELFTCDDTHVTESGRRELIRPGVLWKMSPKKLVIEACKFDGCGHSLESAEVFLQIHGRIEIELSKSDDTYWSDIINPFQLQDTEMMRAWAKKRVIKASQIIEWAKVCEIQAEDTGLSAVAYIFQIWRSLIGSFEFDRFDVEACLLKKMVVKDETLFTFYPRDDPDWYKWLDAKKVPLGPDLIDTYRKIPIYEDIKAPYVQKNLRLLQHRHIPQVLPVSPRTVEINKSLMRQKTTQKQKKKGNIIHELNRSPQSTPNVAVEQRLKGPQQTSLPLYNNEPNYTKINDKKRQFTMNDFIEKVYNEADSETIKGKKRIVEIEPKPLSEGYDTIYSPETDPQIIKDLEAEWKTFGFETILAASMFECSLNELEYYFVHGMIDKEFIDNPRQLAPVEIKFLKNTYEDVTPE